MRACVPEMFPVMSDNMRPWTVPGSSVRQGSQAKNMEWVCPALLRQSSRRDQTRLMCTGKWVLYPSATRETVHTIFYKVIPNIA